MDTATLLDHIELTPAQIDYMILGQIAAYGPQSYDQFIAELWEINPDDLQAALDHLIAAGQLSNMPWICGDIYSITHCSNGH